MNGEGLVERGVIVGDHQVALKSHQLIRFNRKHKLTARHGFDEIYLTAKVVGFRIVYVANRPIGMLGKHVIAGAWSINKAL